MSLMNDYDSNDIQVKETKDRLTRSLFFIRQGADLPTMIQDFYCSFFEKHDGLPDDTENKLS